MSSAELSLHSQCITAAAVILFWIIVSVFNDAVYGRYSTMRKIWSLATRGLTDSQLNCATYDFCPLHDTERQPASQEAHINSTSSHKWRSWRAHDSSFQSPCKPRLLAWSCLDVLKRATICKEHMSHEEGGKGAQAIDVADIQPRTGKLNSGQLLASSPLSHLFDKFTADTWSTLPFSLFSSPFSPAAEHDLSMESNDWTEGQGSEEWSCPEIHDYLTDSKCEQDYVGGDEYTTAQHGITLNFDEVDDSTEGKVCPGRACATKSKETEMPLLACFCCQPHSSTTGCTAHTLFRGPKAAVSKQGPKVTASAASHGRKFHSSSVATYNDFYYLRPNRMVAKSPLKYARGTHRSDKEALRNTVTAAHLDSHTPEAPSVLLHRLWTSLGVLSTTFRNPQSISHQDKPSTDDERDKRRGDGVHFHWLRNRVVWVYENGAPKELK
ncbi:hypothetical protein CEUSTIGMA_g741.t1 [Chlamydomonas eustigma]|uniref:Uncharacterized protein n=1 Tax=Chlamydomonas eustigma TaxID=1157962 RepID=A0A250WR20_9CHLO|nr:hypothetical protein CEUSTIGMA_g741.t1 [Chlamydomonas eustigma]|eukprot:GAX73287.1 hypothetical protein CEUSTIGMA_g741.t1 [Chlamydomonas eustigma]